MAVIILSVERHQHEIQVETWVPTAGRSARDGHRFQSVCAQTISIKETTGGELIKGPYLRITFAELWLRGPTEGEGVILSLNSYPPLRNSANPAYRPDEVAVAAVDVVMPPGLCGFRKSLFLRDKFLGLALIGPPLTPVETPRNTWDLPVYAVSTGVNGLASAQFVELSPDVWFISCLGVNLVVLLGILPWGGLQLLSGRERRTICDGRSVVLLVRLRPASSVSDACHIVTLSVHSNRNEIHNILIAIELEISTHQNRY
ncbi:hypothetical protein BDV41DRAFT_576615 [Aspergillus transmontanensis]|uniref:Uncharacterized protein n=1 Tax=Aspergillus transmontanensis TaxID=1034304 RepID=A0A5N6W2P6_9EURO|nr:hypothetical protein BDV41DRAFT_576615 [Aspergillus transmontanensis]